MATLLLPALVVVGGLCVSPTLSAFEMPTALKSPKLVNRLNRYIRDNIPKGSPLREQSYFAKSARTKDFEHARKLRHFEDVYLVRVIYMSPTAGSPGQVLEDMRILYNVKRDRFMLGSLDWIDGFRRRHPLQLTTMSKADLASYIQEIVSIIPRADRWGFRLKKLECRNPQRCRIEYKESRQESLRGELGNPTDVVAFYPGGRIREFHFVQRDIPRDR